MTASYRDKDVRRFLALEVLTVIILNKFDVIGMTIYEILFDICYRLILDTFNVCFSYLKTSQG